MRKYCSSAKGFYFLFMCMLAQTVMAELVIKPSVGYGSPAEDIQVGPLYTGQVGFSHDTLLGDNRLLSLFSSADTAWWQSLHEYQATVQGGAELSLGIGRWIYLVGMQGVFQEDRTTNTAPTGSITARLVGIHNSTDYSLQLEGEASVVFGQTYDTVYTGTVSASFLQGELVIKPSVLISASFSHYTPVSWSVGPKIGFSWYPPFPINLGIFCLYQHDIMDTDASWQIAVDLAVQPLSWLGFNLSHGAEWTEMNYNGTAKGELRFSLASSPWYTSGYFIGTDLEYVVEPFDLTQWKITTGISFQIF
ncbi:MAG: hypothetical protein WHT84_00475 [Breznakiellaceae bacterium]